MGNSVSAHIYETKVFRPYPVGGKATVLYCIDSDWTPLSIGGKKLVSIGTTKFGILGGKATGLYEWPKPNLKSMGNSVSAHIYKTKVFRPYPVILYRLRLDPSIHWCKKIGVPRNDQTSLYAWPKPHLKSTLK